MNQVKETMIGFLIGAGIYAVVVEVVGIFFSEDILSYTLGLLFGLVIAILLIVHMAHTLNRALDLSQGQAMKYTRRQSYLRLVMMLVAMIIALLVNQLNFITAILGILGLKIGALIAPFFLRRLFPDSYMTKIDKEEDTDDNTIQKAEPAELEEAGSDI